MTTATPRTPPPASEIHAIEFYWRPGCAFCSGLRRGLDRRGIPYRASDIWHDEDAAALVRSAARGHETVPTVGIADEMLVNPRIAEVLDVLDRVAPHLMPPQPSSDPGRRRLRELFHRLRP